MLYCLIDYPLRNYISLIKDFLLKECLIKNKRELDTQTFSPYGFGFRWIIWRFFWEIYTLLNLNERKIQEELNMTAIFSVLWLIQFGFDFDSGFPLNHFSSWCFFGVFSQLLLSVSLQSQFPCKVSFSESQFPCETGSQRK